jgi:hypothetical protein
MTAFPPKERKRLPKKVYLGAGAILMIWGFAAAWPPWPPPPWGDPAIVQPGGGEAEDSYSVPFDSSRTNPVWYVQTALGLSAQDASDTDLYREPDGAGGWIETEVDDEVTAAWEYLVEGKPVTEITGPAVFLAVCVWDDKWDPDDLSAEAQARNDPAVQDSVTINIVEQ